MSVRLTATAYDALYALAQEEDSDIAGVIREAIERRLGDHSRQS